jgi:glutaredoxin 3
MRVRVYVEEGSPACASVKRVLDDKGIRYEEIDVSGDPDRRAEMARLSGGDDTVPQIFFGDRHLGGYEQLRELERDQGVRTLLPGEGRWAPEP